MVLDPTARESNVRDSIKKFLVDGLNRTDRIPVTFDRGLKAPVLQGQSVDRWVSVLFGEMDRSAMSEAYLQVYACTRRDNEGFRLAQLGDKILGYFSDTSQTDGMARIPFYRSAENDPWELLGALLVQDVMEGPSFDIEDETKVKLFTVRLRWAAKI